MASILYSPAIDLLESASQILFSPFLSGPVLLSATYCPDIVRHAVVSVTRSLPDRIGAFQGSLQDHPHAITGLRVLFALSIIRGLNRALNTMASNSWRMGAGSGWEWPNEIAIVTGGASGIGKGIAERLASLGVRVAVLDIQDLPKDMQGDGRIHFFHCDVTSPESVAAAADAIRRQLGHATILVNNAGIARPLPILKTDAAYLRKIMGVNLMSLWFTTQQFLPNMIQQNKGHIVTVASIASFVALATAADYAATKAGALAFHESLASEIKHQYKAPKVLTSVVHPNFVKTPLLNDFSWRLERVGMRMLTTERIADEVVAQLMRKRGGQLVIPSSASVIRGLRGWPTWLQELLRDTIASAAVKP